MKRKLLITGLVVMTTLSMLCSCGKKEPEVVTVQTEAEATETEEVSEEPVVSEVTEAETETEIIEVTETEEEETRPGQLKSAFTGKWIDEELAMVRPVCVMIENTPPSLPQYGLSKADIIYEFPVEAGISRIMGVFQDFQGMERFGNCRSARPYYILTALEYDAIYVHAGGSTEAYDLIHSDIIDEIDGVKGDGNYFYRTSDKKAPHNLYTSSDKVNKAIESKKFTTTISDRQKKHFNFASEDETYIPQNAVDCAAVRIAQTSAKPYFIYNEQTGLYERYEFGKKQIDAITDEQLAVKNIIIQEITSTIYNKDKGTLNISLIDSGNGKYITSGKCIDITWSKDSQSGITSYCDQDGNPITLNAGTTWIDVTNVANSSLNIIYSTMSDFE